MEERTAIDFAGNAWTSRDSRVTVLFSTSPFMFTRILVKDLRVFAGKRHTFDLSPLTVFCGTNSSGKSTLLRVLPLLRENIRPSGARALNHRFQFKTSDVDFGNFRAAVSENDVSRMLEIGVTVE